MTIFEAINLVYRTSPFGSKKLHLDKRVGLEEYRAGITFDLSLSSQL